MWQKGWSCSSCRRNEAAFGGEAVVKSAGAMHQLNRDHRVCDGFAAERSLVPSAAATDILVHLGNIDAFGEQHAYQANQRQADQAGGVIAFGALKQAHAQTFGFEAACAVVGLFGEQVALDLFCA